MQGDLARTSIHGVAWTLLRVLGQTGIGFGVGIYLARTLEIQDFGLMAIAMSLIGLSELISGLGVEASLIQRQVLSSRHLSVAFSMSLIMAAVLFIFFALLGWPLAKFFNQPELAWMLPVLGLGQCFATAGMVPRAILRRRFDYKLLSKIEISAYFLGYALTSVILATLGFGVWSMVLATVLWFFLSCVLLFRAAKAGLRLAWFATEARELLNFGVLITAKSVINYLAVSSSDFMIGKFLGAMGLGLYSRAHQLAYLPLQKIASVFSSVMFPIYASVQNDHRRLTEAYLKTVAAVSLLTIPPLAVTAMASELVVGGLYGSKWLPAAPIFSVLCLAGMLVCILHLAGALVEATDNVLSEIKCQAMYFVILLVGFSIAVQYSLLAVAWVVVTGALFLYLAMGHLALRILKARWADFFLAQLLGVVIALVMAAVTALILPWLAGWGGARSAQLAILIAFSVVFYLAALWLVPDRWVFGAKQLIVAKILKRRAAANEAA